MRIRKEIVEYMKQGRNAVILDAPSGLEVDLYENDNFIETITAHEHSEDYARDIAENWINKIRGNSNEF